MKLYHATSRAVADGIAKHGFTDPKGGRFVGEGLWFAERSLVGHPDFEGDDIDAYVVIEVDAAVVQEYKETPLPGRDYEEWHIPYDIANRFFKDRTVYP